MDVPSIFVGLALAIPIGILTNLLTPRVQRWWSTGNPGRLAARERTERRMAAQRARDEGRIARFAANPIDLTHFLLLAAVDVIALGLAMIAGLVAIPILLGLGQLFPLWNPLFGLLSLFAGFFAVTMFLVMYFVASSALKIGQRARRAILTSRGDSIVQGDDTMSQLEIGRPVYPPHK